MCHSLANYILSADKSQCECKAGFALTKNGCVQTSNIVETSTANIVQTLGQLTGGLTSPFTKSHRVLTQISIDDTNSG
jgi:hypothetical protein